MGFSPCPTRTWLMSAFPSPKRNEETWRDGPGMVAKEGPGAGNRLLPEFASSFRKPLAWNSISHFFCPVCPNTHCAASRQRTNANFFGEIPRMEWKNGKDKEP